ncbi:vesicle transport protein GOT1A isoform X2 [Cavia porcellus]|uniref:vesicle transport protein GOT1A isoform X2 n=1 Tax=Cavia porcellus TaxID=10141 RepID=UPI002FDFF4E8
MISISEGQKIGVGITGFGVFFILFGILLYFDSVLLAFGNRHKLKGTSFFLGGVAIVLLRWPLLGMLLETYGFFSLFKMNSLASWQLLLLLCVTSLGEPPAKVGRAENPRPTGQRLGPLALLAPWAQGLQCAARKPALAGPRPRGAPLCPPGESSAEPARPGLCVPHSRLIPAPRGSVLVQREKDLSTYNWNSFGLRYGKRQAAQG